MIAVFGSTNMDLVATVAALPAPGETVPGRDHFAAPGGKGANQALAAARAGASVRFVSAVGRDAHAAPALALLRAAGADLTATHAVDGPTGVALILVDAAGENVIAVVPGANASLGVARAADLALGPGDTLLAQFEAPGPGVAAALRAARDAGARSILNPAPYLPDARALLSEADLVIVNEGEGAAALGAPLPKEPEAAVEMLAEALGTDVALTLGPRGAAMRRQGETFRAASPRIEAVDATGAGDAFCGHLAAAFDRGEPPQRALDIACAAGAAACLGQGAQPAAPTLSQALALLP
ncbi:MAG: PfkB family carbohydrate kinase [Pseudomonadota bacterium]